MLIVFIVLGFILAAVLLLQALRLLLQTGWFLAWLKGTLGFSLLALAVFMVFVSWQMSQFGVLNTEKNLANISFVQLSDQSFRAVLTENDGHSQTYIIKGDMWQLDARLIRWSSWLANLGMLPNFQLDRLSGRYLSLEDEQRKPRSVFKLGAQQPLSLWLFMNKYNRYLPWLKAQYGNGTYMPMVDGALYSISLNHLGLTTKPLNERAKQVVSNWQ